MVPVALVPMPLKRVAIDGSDAFDSDELGPLRENFSRRGPSHVTRETH